MDYKHRTTLAEIVPIKDSPPSPKKRRHSDVSTHGLPTDIRVEIAKNRIHMKEEEYENTYRSCCLGNTDKRLIEYITQAVIGGGIIIYCCYQLTYADCEQSGAYWGLLGTTVSFFLTKKINKK